MLIWEGLHSADGEVSLKRLKWDCRIDHLHCRMTSTQEYVNTSRRTIEAVYTFALPFDAVVTRFALETEDKKLEAVIRTQEQAEETYEKAVESGDMPALLEYADNGICTASIGSIKPKEKVVLTIVCEWMLQQVDGTVRVTIPTVIGARYSKDGSQGKLLPHQKVETSILPNIRFRLISSSSASSIATRHLQLRDFRPSADSSPIERSWTFTQALPTEI